MASARHATMGNQLSGTNTCFGRKGSVKWEWDHVRATATWYSKPTRGVFGAFSFVLLF